MHSYRPSTLFIYLFAVVFLQTYFKPLKMFAVIGLHQFLLDFFDNKDIIISSKFLCLGLWIQKKQERCVTYIIAQL